MKPNDRADFMALMTDAMAFYGRDMSDFALSVWWQACEPFELEQVGKALSAHAMDPERGQFAPKPADIVRQLQGTQADRSLMAWAKVLEAIQRVGAYQSVAFDDPAIHCCIEDMGGWPKVARSTYDELPHVQRRFCEAHRAYSAPGRQGALQFVGYLPGESEAQNRTAGRRVMPPLLVGDPTRAQKVLQLGTQASRPRIAITSSTAAAALASAFASTRALETQS